MIHLGLGNTVVRTQPLCPLKLSAGIRQLRLDHLQVCPGLAIIKPQQDVALPHPAAGFQIQFHHPATDFRGQFHRVQGFETANGVDHIPYCLHLRKHGVNRAGGTFAAALGGGPIIEVLIHKGAADSDSHQYQRNQPLFPHRISRYFGVRLVVCYFFWMTRTTSPTSIPHLLMVV